MTTARIVVALASIVTAMVAVATIAEEPATVPSVGDSARAKGRTLLMVDDHEVLYRSGTRRVMTVPRRHAQEAMIPQTHKWEVAIGWTSVWRDPKSGKHQLWYQAYAGKRAKDKRLECVVCYAESNDGLTWTKPEFDIQPFKEHAKTNIVLVGNGGYGDRYCNSVLVDPDEKDPARRYKMAYYDWSTEGSREEVGLHVAFSPDGVRWTKHDRGPLYKTSYGGRGLQPFLVGEEAFRETPVAGKPPRKSWSYKGTMSDAVDVFRDPVRNKYVIYGKFWIDGPDGGHAWKHGMGRTESDDFLTWSKPRFILGPDDADPPDAEFHTSPVFHHAGRYFCLNQIFDRKARGAIDIELMTSRDGLAWDRNFRATPFLARSEPGLFDSRSIFTNATPVILDDEIRFYYGAYNQSPMGGVKSAPGQRSGVGMVSIPRDRFAGLRPVDRSEQATLKKPLEKIGQVTLKPLDFAGCRAMKLNADVKGSLRVELLDEDGYRVRGFTADDVTPITGDSLRHTAQWNGASLESLAPGRYQVRVHLDDATLYAVTFE